MNVRWHQARPMGDMDHLAGSRHTHWLKLRHRIARIPMSVAPPT